MKWILLAVFLIGAPVYVAQSYAAPTTPKKDDYCFYGLSGTIEKPRAVMSFKTGSMLIAENGKTETWEHGGSVGTGMNGSVFYQGDHAALYSTSICIDANTDPPSEPTILIFKDRVFWPCDHDWRPKPSKSRRRHHADDLRQCYDTEDGRNPVYSTTDPE
jgi:hypothetical protein